MASRGNAVCSLKSCCLHTSQPLVLGQRMLCTAQRTLDSGRAFALPKNPFSDIFPDDSSTTECTACMADCGRCRCTPLLAGA